MTSEALMCARFDRPVHNGILPVLLVCVLARGAVGFAFQEGGGSDTRAKPEIEVTKVTATGEAADVLALEEKIEDAVLRGDVAFAETVLSSDFHFRHGDGWTRGETTGGMEDDRAAFLKRIADKEYLIHDLDKPKIEMHGDLAIT